MKTYRVRYFVASASNSDVWLPRVLIVEAESPAAALEAARRKIVVKTAIRTKLAWVDEIPAVIEAVVVCRVAGGSLREAERLIDLWLQRAEDDDRLISYTVTDRASLAQEGAPA